LRAESECVNVRGPAALAGRLREGEPTISEEGKSELEEKGIPLILGELEISRQNCEKEL